MMKRALSNCLWILSIWYIIIMAINAKVQLTWKLFAHDFLSGFCDNRSYLIRIFLPVTILVIAAGLLAVLLLDSDLVMYWNVRIGRHSFRAGDIRFFRKYRKVFMILTVAGAVCLLSAVSYRNMTGNTGNILADRQVIAHAGGMIDGNDYTNCREAVLTNYEKGYRVFEIDFSLTSDNKLVCKHSWNDVLQEGGVPGEAMDEQTFMNTPILGRYTPLSWESICQLMQEYPDIWVVTDTKHTDTEGIQQEFEFMLSTAKELGLESVLDRVIVQIYNKEMYDTVYQIYPFRSFIFTLYKFWEGDTETFLDCVRFCYEHDIDGITTWNYYVTAELMPITKAYGIPWYAHTENDVENAKAMLELGLSGVYTDSITPDMIEGK